MRNVGNQKALWTCLYNAYVGVPLMEFFRHAYPNIVFYLGFQERKDSLEPGVIDIIMRSVDKVLGDE